ncbi:hypothetical protein CRM22_001608 [Opisthorchis felineus]|uniref:Malate dehydrogenase n=2 Tax=Opisthorchis felineus TaxID=147828 RepID=A0A4S2MA26_OPIFE|nr:hypothetical protein CRM22_001608 [Opisthorchis felineus]
MIFRSLRLYRQISPKYCFLRMSCVTPAEYTRVIKVEDVIQFCMRCLEKVGVNKDHCGALAEVLVAGDHRGHYSHGINRLEMYVMDVEKGVCSKEGEPVIEKETVSTALVNGRNLLGPVVGNFCMKLAIEKAKKTGVAWITAYGSNHFGIAGWYSLMASNAGLLGMAFTNTSPLVYPTRSKQRAMGTNPLTVAAPSSKAGDEFVLDMATSAVALGKIEMCRRRGIPIPHGWGADKNGKSTTDPAEAAGEGALFPLGGEEQNSGYKGFGLGMMVEIFCGIMAGGAYGTNVRRWMATDRPANLGQAFVAIDPNAFASGFGDRMSDYVNSMRNLSRVDEKQPVVIPGDPEREHIEECRKMGGIRYPPVLIDSMDKLADRLHVQRMPVLKELKP